jgi:adenylate cyclase
MTAAGVACDQCGTDLQDEARFCDACGAPIMSAHTPAEYKQVTVLTVFLNDDRPVPVRH